MDANTSEVVGHLARWVLLAVAGAFGIATVMMVLIGGLPASLAAASGWAVVPDAVAVPGKFLRLRSRFRPRPSPHFPSVWWVRSDGEDVTAWVAPNGDTVLIAADALSPGTLGLRAVANPYSGCRVSGDGRIGRIWPKGTELLLLDARALVAVTGEGRLDDRAGSGWRGDAGRVPLAELAERGATAYLVRVPLRDYDRTCRLLRRAPLAPVLPAAVEWDRVADSTAVLDLITHIRRICRQMPLLVTADAALAGQAVAAEVPVVLVGPHPPLPPPGRNVPDWPGLPSHLP